MTSSEAYKEGCIVESNACTPLTLASILSYFFLGVKQNIEQGQNRVLTA